MPITANFRTVSIDSIVILRDERQRRELRDIETLAESIKVHGLIHPILVEEKDGGLLLVAGERRITACKSLGWTTIPVQLASDLTDEESQGIELEENLRRNNLTWQEEVDAIAKIHALYKGRDDSWTQDKTAAALGVTKGTLSQYLTVDNEIKAGNKKILAVPKLSTAIRVVQRKTQRIAQAHLDNLLTNIISPEPTEQAEAQVILNQSFIEWSKHYEGPKFNFLHCDFPYGVDLQASDQMGEQGFTKYHDSKEVYWQLLEALADAWPRLMSPSSSIMFWFSMKFYTETIEFFRERLPQVELSYMPMVWVKSDNKGILPDALHGPRQIYETCLIGYTGDRQVVKSVSNAYSCPTSKDIHMSEKPVPMLKQFFQMYVDETTSMLDPTCGSGNALRAADALGAKRVLGLEIEPEIFEAATKAFNLDKKMRKLK